VTELLKMEAVLRKDGPCTSLCFVFENRTGGWWLRLANFVVVFSPSRRWSRTI